MKTRRLKNKKTKRMKKMKGGISENNFLTLHSIIVEIARKTVSMTDILDYIEVQDIQFGKSIKDWFELVARCFRDDIYIVFDHYRLGKSLRDRVDYEHPVSFTSYSGNVDEKLYLRVVELANPSVFFKDVMDHLDAINLRLDELNREHPDETAIKPITLSFIDWCELIAQCHKDGIHFLFDESELGEQLKIVFDYKNPTSFAHFKNKLVIDRPRSLSGTQGFQGSEGTCFAHSAALIISHNMYKNKLTEEEEAVYEEAKCNSYLETPSKIDNYGVIQSKCGVNGAIRILLYLYIYHIIVGEFGYHGGSTTKSILFYLQTSFRPIFSEELNAVLRPIVESVNNESFSVSFMSMAEFTENKDYRDYLEEYLRNYYAKISIKDQDHVVTIVGTNERGIIGKDSGHGRFFYIPYDQFRPDGIFRSSYELFRGIPDITFLYETKNSFSEPFSRLLNDEKCIYDNGILSFKTE